MKNLFKIFLIISLSLIMLVSCNKKTSNNGDNSGQNNVDGGWPGVFIAYYRGADDLALENLENRFTNETTVSLSLVGGEEGDNFFILGNDGSELSARAYWQMEKIFTYNESNSIFLIYSDGKSVAIAYDSAVSRYAAIEYFFDNFNSLKLTKPGIVAVQEFDRESYIAGVHGEYREMAFEALNGVLSDSAINELKNLYNLYDRDVYYWLINLWDPTVGGFYYSNSARDTEGFLPDLESTAQALLFMQDSGMISEFNNKYKDALPSEITDAILNYAKNAQDPNDGYFYHEQWGNSVSVARLGRDLGWATRIISALGSKPYWNTPNGVRGEYGAPGSSPVVPKSASTKPSVAVSGIIFAARPAYFDSVELFLKHLEEDYDWENDSYNAGNDIESQLGQIQNAGVEFTEALIDFLNKKQKANGLWENEISYNSINGLMKISGVYTSLRKTIPNADKAMDSAIIMLKSNATATHVCSVYNPWEAVANILISIEKVNGKAAADELREKFRTDAEELIRITAEKLSVFKKDDGGFSYFIRFSASTSQGASVALSNTVESDVNATMICTNSIITSMFDVFGLERVDRYYPVDFASMYDSLNDLGAIIKDEMPEMGPITFDDYDADYGEEQNGVIMYPDLNAHTIIGDMDKDDQDLYKWFQNAIVENPVYGADDEDLVLYTKSNVYVGATKPLADKASSTRFHINNANINSVGDCYVYDADMYFVPGYGKTNSSGATTSDPIIQIFFMTDNTPAASVNVSVYTENGVDYIKIGENFAGIDGKDANVAGGIPVGQWVNLRLEYYKLYETDANGKEVFSPKLKVYVNGEYQGECDGTITGTDSSGKLFYYDRKVSLVTISYYRFLASEIYFNNVVAERCNKEYVKENNPNKIVDAVIPDEEMRESYGFEDGLLNTSNVANKVRVYDFGAKKYINATEGQTYNPYISYSIVVDPQNAANHVLKVVALKSDMFDKPSRTEVSLYNAAANGTNYSFSGKFYYSAQDIGTSGDLTQIFFFDTLEGQAYSIRVNAVSANGGYVLRLIENNSSNEENVVICDNISCDSWFDLKIVFHRTKQAETTGASIYLNGILVLEDTSYGPAAINQNPISKVAIVHQRTNNSTLYLDDLSFTRDGEIVEAVESAAQVATFTEGFNTKYLHNFTFEGTIEYGIEEVDPIKLESLFTKFYLIQDPTDATNQVLRAVNKNGGTKAGYTKVDISNENPEGECYVFETKIFLETYTAGYNLSEFRFVDSNGNPALSTYLSVDKDTGFVKLASTGSGAYPEAGSNYLYDSGIELKGGKTEGQWFTLRMEFYNKGAAAGTDNTYLKLYINDILVYNDIAYRTLGAEITHVEIIHCKTNKSSAVYYDDISLIRINKEYSK